MKNRWLMALALIVAGAAGGMASSFMNGRDAQAQQGERPRYEVSAWAFPDAASPRHGAFVVDRESGDLWVVVGRYSEVAEAARLCKTDYPSGLLYVGKAKK